MGILVSRFSRSLMVGSVLFLMAAPQAQAGEQGRLLKFYNGNWERYGNADVLEGAGVAPGSMEDPMASQYRPLLTHGICGGTLVEMKKKTWQRVLKVTSHEGTRELERELVVGSRYSRSDSNRGSKSPNVTLPLRTERIDSGGLLPGGYSAGAHFEQIVTEENPGELSPSTCTVHSVAGAGCFRRSSEVIELRALSQMLVQVTIHRSHQQGRGMELTKILPVRCTLRRVLN
ncbi:MAG: hypothetical protein IT285_15975 [Bdellovibrionales bacterium]|nr:hypothetical protein [Bdellovibrionales bacterium]